MSCERTDDDEKSKKLILENLNTNVFNLIFRKIENYINSEIDDTIINGKLVGQINYDGIINPKKIFINSTVHNYIQSIFENIKEMKRIINILKLNEPGKTYTLDEVIELIKTLVPKLKELGNKINKKMEELIEVLAQRKLIYDER